VLNEATLRQVMATVLQVPEESIGPNASMDNVATWDSLRHMNLILALEEEFGASIPDEDAANLTSYALLKVVLEELLSET